MANLKNRHVVAIDDTPAILTFLRVTMETLEAEFHEAQTASYGLALCEQIKPDVVILDLGLPDKEGLDIISRLKRIDKSTNLPVIIVLTVRSEPTSRERAMMLGADAYFTKPVNMEALVETIYRKLGMVPDDEAALGIPQVFSV
jgi:two-component system, OmpR family, KDP operon response regulator KdpE